MSSPFAMPADMSGSKDALMFDLDVVTGTTSALLAISTIAVALRIWVRTRMTKTFGLDDGAMIAAWVLYVVTASLTYTSVANFVSLLNTGKPIATMGSLVQIIRYCNAAYAVTMLLVKISLGLFFLKLFKTSTNYRWQRIAIWASMGVATVMGIVYLIMTIATCGIMIQSQKTTSMNTGSDWCPSQQTFVNISIAWSLLNTVSDGVLTGLGVWALVKAKMSPATKLSASLLLIFGSIGVIASCIRIAVQFPLVSIEVSGILLVEWSNIEAGVCIIAGSMVTLRPLYQRGVASARTTIAELSWNSTQKTSGTQSDQKSSATQSHQKSSATRSDASTVQGCARCTRDETLDIEKGEKEGIIVTTTHALHSKDSDDLGVFGECTCKGPQSP